jgi:magnesium chelatase family protein
MMDEFPEFPRSVLESLRQPLEDGLVTVTRSKHSTTFPARFMLVAAMNPCPCGHLGTEKPCRCPPRTLQIYRQRLSGPLLDRIDMHVHVGRVEARQLLSADDAESSADVRLRVEEARDRAATRCATFGATCNAEIPSGRLLQAAGMDEQSGYVLSRLAKRHALSGRSVHRVVRVARTIADLECSPSITREHVLEAATYRLFDEGRGS